MVNAENFQSRIPIEMTGTIGSLDESQRDPLSLLAIMKTINAEKNIPFDVDKSGSAPSEKFPPSKSEPNLKPAISEEKSPDGDLYIKNGYLQSLALPGGEGMKIDKNGKISLYDEEGKSAGDGKITKGKDGFTIEFSNGISVTMASDGKQSILYPSGASVIVNEKNMIESVQHKDGKPYQFNQQKSEKIHPSIPKETL